MYVFLWLELELAVPWLNRQVAGLSPRRLWFDSRTDDMRFVVKKRHWERFLLNYDRLSLSVSGIIFPRSSIHLQPTLYNVFLPVLQFSPVSIIPPLLHTHPSIYHPHCIMFFSQYFSFPLSVSFHHCSILIHPSTTHAV